MKPSKTFEAQQEWFRNQQAQGQSLSEEITCLQITSDQSEFIVPIHEVKEVSEYLPIYPYPRETPAYIGVVNLRGNVVPILSLSCFFPQGKRRRVFGKERLVFLVDPKLGVFGVLVDTVKKVLYAPGAEAQNEAITLNGKPVHLIRLGDLLRKWSLEL